MKILNVSFFSFQYYLKMYKTLILITILQITVSHALIGYERNISKFDPRTNYMRPKFHYNENETYFEKGISICGRWFMRNYYPTQFFWIGYWPHVISIYATELSFFVLGRAIFEGKIFLAYYLGNIHTNICFTCNFSLVTIIRICKRFFCNQW